MASKLNIWNLALGRCVAEPIQSIDENSLGARECRRWYPVVIAAMLEGPHEWSFAIRRQALALVANDRPNEWLYAYQLPTDVGSPIRILPDFQALGLNLSATLADDPFGETWPGLSAFPEIPYEIADDVLYTSTENATLEFVINTIEEGRIGSILEKAIALDLASHLALSVSKDRKLRGEILQESEVAWARAMADDLNRQPQRLAGYVSDSLLARDG